MLSTFVYILFLCVCVHSLITFHQCRYSHLLPVAVLVVVVVLLLLINFRHHQTGNTLSFYVDDEEAMELPLTEVAQSNRNKNEVVMDFHQEDIGAHVLNCLFTWNICIS